MNEHIAGEILAAYVDGTLSSEARQGAESHISRCRECRQALAEVVEIRGRRVKVPREFLSRALEVQVENSSLGNRISSKNVVPLRLVFGVAAVFVVALAVGYLFLGRGGTGMPGSVERETTERTVALERGRAPVLAEKSEPARQDASVPDREAAAASDMKAETKPVSTDVVSGPLPAEEATPVASPAKETREQTAAAEDRAMPLRAEDGAVGRVIGRVEAIAEKDMAGEATMAAPAPAKGGMAEKAKARRSPSGGDVMAVDAIQLFLAATGRAAAPRLLRMEAAPAVRFAGDVEQEDLLDPWSPAGWEWLPDGSALEMTIAADGSVRTVELLGQWETNAAARAKAAAMKLTFSVAGRETRRVVLSRDPVN